MKTAEIWIEVFTQRTTGRRRMFTIVNLTLDAVKTVIGNTQIKLDTDNAIEDINNGYMRRVNCTGFYNGNDGYVLTAKGYKELLKMLQMAA